MHSFFATKSVHFTSADARTAGARVRCGVQDCFRSGSQFPRKGRLHQQPLQPEVYIPVPGVAGVPASTATTLVRCTMVCTMYCSIVMKPFHLGVLLQLPLSITSYV